MHIRIPAAIVTVLLGLAVAGCGRTPAPTAPTTSSSRFEATGSRIARDAPIEASASSEVGSRAVRNVPPAVTIVSPQPSPLLARILPPRFTVQWASVDPDGPAHRPKSYRYRLFLEDDPEFPLFLALVDPDSLRRFYAPRFEGWTEVSGRVDSVTIQDLPVNERGLFVITAFDHRGDFDPVFSLSKNMLHFEVSPVAASGVAARDGAERGGPGPEPGLPIAGSGRRR